MKKCLKPVHGLLKIEKKSKKHIVKPAAFAMNAAKAPVLVRG
jgi:hypothetical protein